MMNPYLLQDDWCGKLSGGQQVGEKTSETLDTRITTKCVSFPTVSISVESSGHPNSDYDVSNGREGLVRRNKPAQILLKSR